MTRTLYLEGEYISRPKVNPFYHKLVRSKTPVLYITDQMKPELEEFIKEKNPKLALKHLPPEEALSFLKEIQEEDIHYSLFIEDRIGNMEKQLFIEFLNSPFFKNAFVMIRSIDWTTSTKATLTSGFDTVMLSKTVIVSEQELFKYISIFPESEQQLMDWIESSIQLSATSYYVFNKQVTQNSKVQLFMVFDGNSRQFISSGKEAIPISSKKTRIEMMFEKLEEMGSQIHYIGNLVDKQDQQEDNKQSTMAQLLNQVEDLKVEFGNLKKQILLFNDIDEEIWNKMENSNSKYKMEEFFEEESQIKTEKEAAGKIVVLHDDEQEKTVEEENEVSEAHD